MKVKFSNIVLAIAIAFVLLITYLGGVAIRNAPQYVKADLPLSIYFRNSSSTNGDFIYPEKVIVYSEGVVREVFDNSSRIQIVDGHQFLVDYYNTNWLHLAFTSGENVTIVYTICGQTSTYNYTVPLLWMNEIGSTEWRVVIFVRGLTNP